MGLKFIGTSVILERKHELYPAVQLVKVGFFQSPNTENVVMKVYGECFNKMRKSKRIVMSRENFDKLPADPEAKASQVLAMMGWR